MKNVVKCRIKTKQTGSAVENKFYGLIFCLLLSVLFIVSCRSKSRFYSSAKLIEDNVYEVFFSLYNDNNLMANTDEISEIILSEDTKSPKFLIHIRAGEDRYASIGIACHPSVSRKDMQSEDYLELLSSIPDITLDGINEMGVMCAVNIVPNADSQKTSDYKIFSVPRLVLNNASSARDAMRIIEGMQINGNLADGYNVQYIVADLYHYYTVTVSGDEKIITELTPLKNISIRNSLYDVDRHIMRVGSIIRYI